MIDIKVYREYWEGVQKRIPEIKKVLPVTIDEEMSKTIQGLSKDCLLYTSDAADEL